MGMNLEPRYYVTCDQCGREATSIGCRTRIAAKDVARLAGFVQRTGLQVPEFVEWKCPYCAQDNKQPGGG